jgi:hypothetical protein
VGTCLVTALGRLVGLSGALLFGKGWQHVSGAFSVWEGCRWVGSFVWKGVATRFVMAALCCFLLKRTRVCRLCATMVRLRSWEGGQRPAAPAAPPEDAAETEKKVEAGVQLSELLLRCNVDGRLSAKDLCTIAYWASKAGALGPVRSLAHNPEAPSGHFQRHLDRVAGLRGAPDTFMHLQVPGHTKYNAERDVQEVKVLPPHESLNKEVVRDPGILDQIRPEEWPPSHGEHQVVRANRGGRVVPLALYLDAAQYTSLGAAVVVFVVCNLVSGARHLAAVLKKRDFCRCGCRGWCSLRPVFTFLDWSFCALANGAYPATRPDGAPWDNSAGDQRRRHLSGLPLELRGAIVQIKGDWAEFSHSLGFPTWRHTDFPCIWCRCDRESMYSWEDMGPGDMPWTLNTPEDYEAACARCEHHVVVRTRQLRNRIAASLFYDKRTSGSRGRALRVDIPELNLMAGDRLEPSAGCPDVGAFEHLSLPATVVFWRHDDETLSKHRNPIFNAFTGISLNTLTVDTLHCFYLGVLQVHCSRVIWGLVEADVWETRQAGNTTAPARLQESCTRLQASLARWCQERRRSHPNERLTDVQEVSPYILGASKEEQRLGLKGGETKTIFMFLHDVLPQHAANVEKSNHMLEASRALWRHMALLKEAPRRFSASQEEDRRSVMKGSPSP